MPAPTYEDPQFPAQRLWAAGLSNAQSAALYGYWTGWAEFYRAALRRVTSSAANSDLAALDGSAGPALAGFFAAVPVVPPFPGGGSPPSNDPFPQYAKAAEVSSALQASKLVRPRLSLSTLLLPDGAVPAQANTGQALQSLSAAPSVADGVVRLDAPGLVSYHMPQVAFSSRAIRVGCRLRFDNGSAGFGSVTYGVFSSKTLADPALNSSMHVAITPTAWVYQVIQGGSANIIVVPGSAVSWQMENSKIYEAWTVLDPATGVAVSRLPDGRFMRSKHDWIKQDCRFPFWETVWTDGASSRPGWADPWADDQVSGFTVTGIPQLQAVA